MNKKYYIAPIALFEEVHEEELLAGSIGTDCAAGDSGTNVQGPDSGGPYDGTDMSKSLGGYWNLEE